MTTTSASIQPSMTDDRQDSGYVTQFPSPDGNSADSTQTSCLDADTGGGKSRSVPSAPTPIAGLDEFDKIVDDATLSRFRHVNSLLEEPLLEYIRRKIRSKIRSKIRGKIRNEYRPIAIRLMVLGRSEDDAKPCIVVLCPEQQSEEVKKFFNKNSVRTLCRPEGSQPSFEVVVVGQEPKTMQADEAIDVFISMIDEREGYTTDTYCGAPIFIRQPSGIEKRCTLGGIIKTTWSNGEIKLYGLTVGHALLGDLEDDLMVRTESNEAKCSNDWGFELSDSESEAESDDSAQEEPDHKSQSLHAVDELQLTSADITASWAAQKLTKIGSITKGLPQYQSTTTNTKHSSPKTYYDWALIDMVSYKPNYLRPRKLPPGEVQDEAFKSGDLILPTSPSSGNSTRQKVVLATGSEGLKRGSLSALPSRLLLGPGKEFVDTFILNLDSEIIDGDSGSWVVNERTLEVYGYIVAADAFGGGYIIPLVEALRNIRDTLGCQYVDLATTIDMTSVKLEGMRSMNGEAAAATMVLATGVWGDQRPPSMPHSTTADRRMMSNATERLKMNTLLQLQQRLPQQQPAKFQAQTQVPMKQTQNHRRDQMSTNGGQNPPHMQNRTSGQMGPMNSGMGGQTNLGMAQAVGPAKAELQFQMPLVPQTPRAIAMIDSMDLSPQVLEKNSVAQHVSQQLAEVQSKPFQVLFQKRNIMLEQQVQNQPQQQQQQQQQAQNPNINPAMQNLNSQGPNGQPMQRPMGSIPPQVLQVTPQELMHVRNLRPDLTHLLDEQLRLMVTQMKRQSWIQQRGQQTQVQGQGQVPVQTQDQQGRQNHVSFTQPQMQLQQQQQPATQSNQIPQPQNMQAPNSMGQNSSMQIDVQKQANATPIPEQENARQEPANHLAQPPNPSPAPTPKSLKHPITDENSDAADINPGPALPVSQPNQQQQSKGFSNLIPQQLASYTPEQRSKYDQFIKTQMNRAAGGGQMPTPAENLARLKAIGLEERRQSQSEISVDIPMSPQELAETGTKLQRIVLDMSKIGRVLRKWYAITCDDIRAKMFFRTRLRIIKQFADGEKMTVLKNMFSIRASEIDQARAILESMAKDLAASVYGRGMMKSNSQQQSTAKTQNAQPAQQPPGQQQMQQQQQHSQKQPWQQQLQQAAQGNQSALLNTANLGKNNNKANQKATSKNQTPVTPTTAQPPFQFGALSPHFNPSYGSKIKDMNLQIPPARKKQKVSGQTPQGATPSPQLSKKSSPEARRAWETQAPPKPIFIYKDPNCNMSTIGFPTEQSFQKHVLEKHTKPNEDPMRFVQENLALALGLEAEGTPKKDQEDQESAPTMTLMDFKQGQTPVDTAIKQSGSNMGGKTQDGKTIKVEVTPKPADARPAEVAAAIQDPWASSAIDHQSLMSNFGLEHGLRNVINDINVYRSLTPDDTPESSKDSGSSEPNSDISENTNLDFEVAWQNFDTDLLLDMNNASLDGTVPLIDGSGVDAATLLDQSYPPPDWDEIKTDFSKPFDLDTSYYSMEW